MTARGTFSGQQEVCDALGRVLDQAMLSQISDAVNKQTMDDAVRKAQAANPSFGLVLNLMMPCSSSRFFFVRPAMLTKRRRLLSSEKQDGTDHRSRGAACHLRTSSLASAAPLFNAFVISSRHRQQRSHWTNRRDSLSVAEPTP